jgi:hypothetical protein
MIRIMSDKILFWLDADLTHFGIANSLQKKYDCELFAIIDITNKPKRFFETQSIVKFKRTWFYHDHVIDHDDKVNIEYLSSFEKKYNINLWQIAYNERIFYQFNEYYKFSEHEVLKILECECRLFESVLDEIKPDFILMRAVDLHQNQLFYELCKAKKIRVLLLGQSRFAYRPIVSSRWHEIEGVENYRNHHAGPTRTREELLGYLKGTNTFKQTVEYTESFQSSQRGRISAVLDFLRTKNTNKKTHYTYFGRSKFKVLLKSVTYLIRRRFRESFINGNLVREIDRQTPFLYFPLHLDEESTLLIGAPFFTNQIEVIRHIVKSMPVGYRLYVKEHPAMKLRGWRNKSFYKKIMNLPNVKLLHPSVKPEDIMTSCSLVLSITSTASLEAAFYNKPSIIFADAPYSALPSVHRLKTVEELPNAIRTSLQNKEVDLQDLNKFVNFVNDNSFELDMFKLELGYAKFFYHDGNLVDVEIAIPQMEAYLEKYKEEFDLLADQHISKIKTYEDTK